MNNGKISHPSQVAYIRRYTLSGGGEDGVKIIEVNNGKLRFLLNESKALDIPQLWHEGTNISFVSKNGIVARELPFVRRFVGGLLYTCGLDSVGDRSGYEMHGELHNTPARVTRVEEGDALTVEAEMQDSALFGKHLVLRRKITTAVGSDALSITDTLENRSYRDEEYSILYHVNLGYPMLDEGTETDVDVKSVTPRTQWSKEHADERTVAIAPAPNRFETCYFLQPRKPHATVTNRKLGKKFSLDWSGDTLPHLIHWNSMACGDYAMGLEPSTTVLDKDFAYSTVKAGDSVKFTLDIKVTDI